MASPVGVNSDIIVDGDNGFLATTEDEWYERLARALPSAGASTRMGQTGRRTVESHPLAVVGPRLVPTCIGPLLNVRRIKRRRDPSSPGFGPWVARREPMILLTLTFVVAVLLAMYGVPIARRAA